MSILPHCGHYMCQLGNRRLRTKGWDGDPENVKAIVDRDPTALMLQLNMQSHLCASNKQIAFPVEPAVT